eukprot:1752723-Rhodomonas_salina.1
MKSAYLDGDLTRPLCNDTLVRCEGALMAEVESPMCSAATHLHGQLAMFDSDDAPVLTLCVLLPGRRVLGCSLLSAYARAMLCPLLS